MSAPSAPRCRSSRIDLPGRRRETVIQLSDDARNIRMGVIPADGGQIATIQYRLRNRWTELLYRGLDYSPPPWPGWPGRAPLLWPTVGRTFLPEQVARSRKSGRMPRACQYRMGGRRYRIPIHGFARYRAWSVVNSGADTDSAWVTCAMQSSPETRLMYPFDFQLQVTHRLNKGRVVSLYEVTAGDNDEPMPFSIGNHIGFRMPLTGKGRYEDCTLRTPGTRRNEVQAGLITAKSKRLDLSRPTPLGTGIYSDRVVTGYTSRNAWTEITDPNALTLRVSQKERPVGGRRYLTDKDLSFVYWGQPENNQICPEPWIGWPNVLNTRKHGVLLPPNKRFRWEMTVACRTA